MNGQMARRTDREVGSKKEGGKAGNKKAKHAGK